MVPRAGHRADVVTGITTSVSMYVTPINKQDLADVSLTLILMSLYTRGPHLVLTSSPTTTLTALHVGSTADEAG